MVEQLRWMVASLHVMGWPALVVLGLYIFERLVFLRGRPERRPVLGWYFTALVVARNLITLFTQHTKQPHDVDWPPIEAYERVLYLLVWIVLVAIVEAFVVQGRAALLRRGVLAGSEPRKIDWSAQGSTES